MDLPKALKRFRREYKLTQKQVSSQIGVNIRLYQKYEAGEVEPSASVITAVADAYNVPLDYLVGRNDDAKSSVEEFNLLNTYRNLDDDNRRTLTDMAGFLSMKQGFTQSTSPA